MKLGEILIQLGMLRPEQVRAVLSSRDLLGGRLGTQIVERGLLDTEQISEALSRQLRVPAALQRHFDKADPAILALIKPNLAARYMAIPLVAARSGAKRIVVAMATPQDVLAVDDVSFALGARVEPMVAAELSIARNLKRFYNVEVKLTRPARPEPARGASGSSSSREIPALAATVPLASREALRALADEAAENAQALAPPPGAAVALEDAIHRLSVAEHREQIADILIDFMLPRFGCGLIFLLRGANAHVWRGFAPGVDARAIETISFPMSMPSMFRTAKERALTFRGPPPAEGTHLHGQIWKYLQCEAPADVVVIPIAIGERIINLVYAHASGASGMPDANVRELQAMCMAVGSSFIRLIQQAKEGHQPTTLLPR
jgi:GSPII_E N-terminal domain.